MKIFKTVVLILVLALIELSCISAYAEEPETQPAPKPELFKPEPPKAPFEAEGFIVFTPKPDYEDHQIVWQ